jgi:hypothetical protein
MPSEFLNSDIW